MEKKIMKKMIQSVLAISAVVVLAGCDSEGLSPRERAGITYPRYILSLQTSATNAPAKLILPVHLAVAQVGETAPSDKMLGQLSAQPALIASVSGLPVPGDQNMDGYYHSYNGGNSGNRPTEDYAENIKALRGLARASGADYLFLFGGNVDSWRDSNPLAAMDFTLVGAFIIPGGRIHVDGKGAGVLIDANTGQPIAFVNAECQETQLSPDEMANGATADLSAKVRDQVAAKLGDGLLQKLAALNANSNPVNQ